jgi:hypothetical protein
MSEKLIDVAGRLAAAGIGVLAFVPDELEGGPEGTVPIPRARLDALRDAVAAGLPKRPRADGSHYDVDDEIDRWRRAMGNSLDELTETEAALLEELDQ